MSESLYLSDQYFQQMSQTLRNGEVFSPALLIDKQRLDHNIDQFMKVARQDFKFRIVAKSLPSIPMLRYVMQRANTNRLMSFHLPFLSHVVSHIPDADILLGKPMPVAGAQQFYEWYEQQTNSTFKPEQQLHWLIDSNERLAHYQQLAANLNKPINISLEIDIGLHRGGFSCQQQLHQALNLIKSDHYLTLTGLMGYEAHISKIPQLLGGSSRAFKQAMGAYQQCIDSVIDIMGQDAANNMIFNAGGSSTYNLYQQPSLINELATASALVMPTDFDVSTLTHHQPAAFIAAPILKIVEAPQLPTTNALSTLLRHLRVLPKKACFIYGGNWLASPCYPKKARRANILGHSSNQEMYQLPSDNSLKIDDYLFFRPSQSESVLLQFGQLLLVDNGKITDRWSVFETQQS